MKDSAIILKPIFNQGIIMGSQMAVRGAAAVPGTAEVAVGAQAGEGPSAVPGQVGTMLSGNVARLMGSPQVGVAGASAGVAVNVTGLIGNASAGGNAVAGAGVTTATAGNASAGVTTATAGNASAGVTTATAGNASAAVTTATAGNASGVSLPPPDFQSLDTQNMGTQNATVTAKLANGDKLQVGAGWKGKTVLTSSDPSRADVTADVSSPVIRQDKKGNNPAFYYDVSKQYPIDKSGTRPDAGTVTRVVGDIVKGTGQKESDVRMMLAGQYVSHNQNAIGSDLAPGVTPLTAKQLSDSFGISESDASALMQSVAVAGTPAQTATVAAAGAGVTTATAG